ncbi:MAG: LysR family transcriptional regulator [Alphaproteobacteria bacterium]
MAFMQNYTLRQLEYFVACIDHKSIAGAANALNVSQPTISVAISKLEEQFGIQLLLRHHSQGVSPTANAENILQSARNLLQHAADLELLAKTTGSVVSGNLRIGSFSPLAPTILPALIAEIGRTYPDINLIMSEGSQEHLTKGLFDGALDLALLYDLNLPDGLRKVHLAERMPYVALPEGHPLFSSETISLQQLSKYPMILLDVVPSRDYFIGLFQRVGLKPIIAHSSPSLELVRSMVGQGLGYSILVTRPEGDISHDGKRLIIRQLSDETTPSHIVLASLKSLKPTNLVTSFESVATKLQSA